jgi:hypothetical protein
MTKNYTISVKAGLLLVVFGALLGCDSRIKEHPLPPELKRQLEMKNNPQLLAQAISGKLTAERVQDVPETTTLFVFLRPKGVTGGPPLAVKKLSGIKLHHKWNG